MAAFISWNTACRLSGVSAEYRGASAITWRVRVLQRYAQLETQGTPHAEAMRLAKEHARQQRNEDSPISHARWEEETEGHIHAWLAEHHIYSARCVTSTSFRLEPLCDDWKQTYHALLESCRDAGLIAEDASLLSTPTGWFKGTLACLERLASVAEEPVTE